MFGIDDFLLASALPEILGATGEGIGAATGAGALGAGAEAAGAGMGINEMLTPIDAMASLPQGSGAMMPPADIPYSHPDIVAGPSMANGDFSAPHTASPGMFDQALGWMKEKQPMLDATSKFTKSMSDFGKFLNGTPDQTQQKPRLDQALPAATSQPAPRPVTPVTSSQPAAMPAGTAQPAGPAGLPRTQIAGSVMPSLNPQMTPAERLQKLQGYY